MSVTMSKRCSLGLHLSSLLSVWARRSKRPLFINRATHCAIREFIPTIYTSFSFSDSHISDASPAPRPDVCVRRSAGVVTVSSGRISGVRRVPFRFVGRNSDRPARTRLTLSTLIIYLSYTVPSVLPYGSSSGRAPKSGFPIVLVLIFLFIVLLLSLARARHVFIQTGLSFYL